MHRALEDYDFFRSQLLKCRHECDETLRRKFIKTADVASDAVFERNPFAAQLYTSMDYFIRLTGCSRACDKRVFTTRPTHGRPDEYYTDAFTRLLPYSFMQFCYFNVGHIENVHDLQLGDIGKATSAAFTYHVKNPHDTMMNENIQFYMKHREHDSSQLTDLCEKEFQVAFRARSSTVSETVHRRDDRL